MDIVIESLAGSREKYKFDEDKKVFQLAKILPAGLVFPFPFGFIPGTKGEDGDPLDAFVISETDPIPGCWVDCRIVGCITVKQLNKNKRIRNDRFLAIPEVSEQYRRIETLKDIDPSTISLLETFLVTYLGLESKRPKLEGNLGAKQALHLISMNKKQNA